MAEAGHVYMAKAGHIHLQPTPTTYTRSLTHSPTLAHTLWYYLQNQNWPLDIPLLCDESHNSVSPEIFAHVLFLHATENNERTF